MSLWHILVVAIVLGVPFLLIYLAVRAGVRHGLRDRNPDGGKPNP